MRISGFLTESGNRLADFAVRVNSSEVLNPGEPLEGVEPAGRALKRAANEMRALAINPANGMVDYEMLAESEAYANFRRLTHTLPNCSIEDLGNQDSQLAFWINLYNTLILDAIIHYVIKESPLEDRGFFRRAAYNVCGMRLSADAIEHGILRQNQPHPFLKLQAFGPHDPRRKMILESFDPRIHFALVCGAKSCPPIAFYDGDEIDQQLNQAVASFVRTGGVRLDIENSTLWLSKLLDWYKNDFGGTANVIDLIGKFVNGSEEQAFLARGHYRVRYLDYDWSINAI